MENRSFKRRLDHMNNQSAHLLSAKRKKADESNFPTLSSKGQTPIKLLLEDFEEGYRYNVSASGVSPGMPFALKSRVFRARPHIHERTSSFVVGGSSEHPRTPLRQRHYSPRKIWHDGTAAELPAASPVNGLHLSLTPEVLISSRVRDSPLDIARSSLGFSSFGVVDWSSSGKMSNRRSRFRRGVSQARLNGLSRERLAFEDLAEKSELAKLKEEQRSLEKKLSTTIREPGTGNNMCSGDREDGGRANVTESDMMQLEEYRRSVAMVQGGGERLSVIKTCSNLQQTRFVAPSSALNALQSNRVLEGSGNYCVGSNRKSGEDADIDDLASTNEHCDGNQVKGAGDWRALWDQSNRRNSKLNSIKLEAEYLEQQVAALALSRPTFAKVQKDERDAADAFTPLSEEAENEVDDALGGSDRNKVLTFHEKSSIDVTRAVMQCLLPGAWLNDEVINLYMELLKERELREPKKFLKCHFFNTFFYNKLYKDKRSYDYKAVRRWTTRKKVGYSLSDCDKILVPIHQDIHWCLAVIDIRDRKLEYLDSLRGGDNAVLRVLARYIADEAKDKDGKELDSNTWEHEFPQDIPQQHNGCDCGMFMLKYADFHSRGVAPTFKQTDMPYFRRRMIWELLQLKAT